jgi:hypothetical protein
MISATIEVPSLHCTKQYDEHGNSEPYLWFAYFFADATTLTEQEPIRVFVPDVPDVRALFSGSVGDNEDIDIPPELGTFQVNLEGGALNLAMLGLLVVLWEEDDTSATAMAAGYNEFRIAVHRELNKFVQDFGFTPPDDNQAKKIADAITKSVKEAISAKVDFLSYCFDHQDSAIGFSRAIFTGSALKEPPGPAVTVFELPAINADAYNKVVIFEPVLEVKFIKMGEHRYEFVRPTLRIQKIESVCGEQVGLVNDAGSRRRAVRDELNKLKSQLAKAASSEMPEIRKRIEDLKGNQIPKAQTALGAALRALHDCHVRATHAGNVGVNKSN